MKRFTILPIAALVFSGACADTPSAPMSFERPQLATGNPPPPPVTGTGSVSFTSGISTAATTSASGDAGVASHDGCAAPPPELAFAIEGTYFQNKPGTIAWIHFSPVEGSDQGIIHESQTSQNASGKLTYLDFDIHLLDSRVSLLAGTGDFGSADGEIDAEIRVCGITYPYTGSFSFDWGTPPTCGELCFD
ncbi:MAG: hypothetical protein ACR2G6_13340 [Gemmatimonadaceae bacterium]